MLENLGILVQHTSYIFVHLLPRLLHLDQLSSESLKAAEKDRPSRRPPAACLGTAAKRPDWAGRGRYDQSWPPVVFARGLESRLGTALLTKMPNYNKKYQS